MFIKTSDKVAYPAKVLKMDEDKDLAIVWAPELKQTPEFKLGGGVVIGEQVASFGSPFGIQGMMTIGWVSNIIEEKLVYIFHTAFINGGNSGGPLVNMKGELVGVNQATVMANAFVPAQGMFIAISMQTVTQFLADFLHDLQMEKITF